MNIVIRNIRIVGLCDGGFILEADEESINNLEGTGIVKTYGDKSYIRIYFPIRYERFDILKLNSIWNGDNIDVEIYSAEILPGRSIQKLYFRGKHIDCVSKREEELKNKGKRFIDEFKDVLTKDQLFEILEKYILKED